MLTRRVPERRVVPFRSALDWFFQDPWREIGNWSEGQMAIDLRETDDDYIIEAEMPGVKPEDIEVTLEGNTLLIRGNYQRETEKREGDGGKTGRYILRERESATYARAITLPGSVDAEKVTSKFENGELQITLPKAAEMRARRIPITGGASGARQVSPGGKSSTTQESTQQTTGQPTTGQPTTGQHTTQPTTGQHTTSR